MTQFQRFLIDIQRSYTDLYVVCLRKILKRDHLQDNFYKIILLLTVGDKSSQQKDIEKAENYWREHKESKRRSSNELS